METTYKSTGLKQIHHGIDFTKQSVSWIAGRHSKKNSEAMVK